MDGYSQPAPAEQEKKKYITRGGAGDAARKLRSKDQKERSEGAQYMAAYRRKVKEKSKKSN
jgi:hypothetical protein